MPEAYMLSPALRIFGIMLEVSPCACAVLSVLHYAEDSSVGTTCTGFQVYDGTFRENHHSATSFCQLAEPLAGSANKTWTFE